MNDNLRMMLDASDDLLDTLRGEHAKLEQVMFALYEEIEDNPESSEVAPMLTDANNYAKAAEGTLVALRDYITDIGRELL